jgi:hypothetical protein
MGRVLGPEAGLKVELGGMTEMRILWHCYAAVGVTAVLDNAC